MQAYTGFLQNHTSKPVGSMYLRVEYGEYGGTQQVRAPRAHPIPSDRAWTKLWKQRPTLNPEFRLQTSNVVGTSSL